MTAPRGAWSEPLFVDSMTNRVYRHGDPLELSDLEFLLVQCLRGKRGRVVKTREICETLYGADLRGGVSLEALRNRVHQLVLKLRAKLGDSPQMAAVIQQNADGYGYMLPRHIPYTPPLPSSPLVGRRRQLNEITRLLLDDDVKLLTLVGPPGVGKTRLARQVFIDLAPRFRDNRHEFLLENIHFATEVAERIARALSRERRLTGDTITQHIQYLLQGCEQAGSRVLLFLDNIEQIGDIELLLAELIADTTCLRILATSRERLPIADGVCYDVQPLDCPLGIMPLRELAAVESIALFLSRAKGAVSLTTANAAAISEICRRLDGLPLAIELIAAWCRSMSPTEMVESLHEHGLLPYLTRSARDASNRHNTMAKAIEWSCSRLTEQERRVLGRLSIFAGLCSLPAATAQCGAELGGPSQIQASIASLVDASLLTKEDLVDGSRYRMLSTVRAFCREWGLDDLDEQEARLRHRIYYIDWLEHMWGPAADHISRTEKYALEDAERENLHQALDEAIGALDITIAVALALQLWRYWDDRGNLVVGRMALEKVLDLAASWQRAEYFYQVNWYAELERAAGILSRNLGRLFDASDHLQRSLSLLVGRGKQRHIGFCHMELGRLMEMLWDYGEAEACFRRALRAFEKDGTPQDRAGVYLRLGSLECRERDFEEARKRFNEALDIYNGLSRPPELGLAAVFHSLGLAAYWEHQATTGGRQRLEEARTHLQQAISLRRRAGSKRALASSLNAAGRVEIADNNFEQALVFFSDSLALYHDMNNEVQVAFQLEAMIICAANEAKHERVVKLHAVASRLRAKGRRPRSADADSDLKPALAQARKSMGESAYIGARLVGDAMRRDEAVYYALESY